MSFTGEDEQSEIGAIARLVSLDTGNDGLRYDLQVLRSLRRIIRAVDLYSKRLKSSYQITSPQLLCLLAVAEADHLTVSEIAEKVYLSNSTVVGIIDRLEKKKLVKRNRDKEDRRIVNVVITASGRKLAENAPSPLQDNLAESLTRLPELEQATLALSLEKIVELMEAGHIDAAPILETDTIDHKTQSGKGDD